MTAHTPRSAATAWHPTHERGEFTLHYQPIVAVRDGRLVGLEALLRLERPEGGPLDAEQFVPEEAAGAMRELDGWTLEQACAQVAEWRPLAGALPMRMAINVSAAQLRDPALPGALTDALARHGVHPVDFVVEVTEALVSLGDAQAAANVAAVRELGVQVAVDDFGTGRASLAELAAFPADLLKIDRAFIAGLGRSESGTAVVAALVMLGQALGLAVVAEGVTTREQLTILRGLGCDLAQGFLFAAPAPPEDIARVLALAGT